MIFLSLIYFLFLSAPAPQLAAATKEYALVTVPVADLLLVPSYKLAPSILAEDFYNTISLSPERGPNSCPRYRQARLHDVVHVLATLGDEVHIEAPHILRYDTTTKKYESDCYISKKNLITLKELRKNNIDYQKLIPSASNRSIILTKPWFDETTQTAYSVGTIFVYSKKVNNAYHAYRLSTSPLRIDEIDIPQTEALPLKNRKPEEACALFLDTLRSWCSDEQQAEGVVPYVWGGCSIIKRYKKRSIYVRTGECYGKPTESWDDHEATELTRSGVDCSGAILLAARVANLPYALTNTTSITTLQEVTSFEDLKNGDFLWCSGHVVIVDSLADKTVIQAQGYSHQTGHLHKAALKTVFPNISSFSDFFALKKEGKPIIYDKTTYKNFKAFSLSSVFSLKTS